MIEPLPIFELNGPARRIWLNRPELRNAPSGQLLDQLNAAFCQAESDAKSRVIVLAAKGSHCSADHLTNEFRPARQAERKAANHGA